MVRGVPCRDWNSNKNVESQEGQKFQTDKPIMVCHLQSGCAEKLEMQSSVHSTSISMSMHASVAFFPSHSLQCDTPGLLLCLFRRELKSQNPVRGWTGETTSKALAVLTENPSSVPCIHIRQLITTSNCDSWAPDTLVWSHLHHTCAYPHPDT